MALTELEIKTWKGLAESKEYQPFKSIYQRKVFTQIMENSVRENAFENGAAVRKVAASMLTEAPTTSTGPDGLGPNLQPGGTTTGNVADGTALAGYDPIIVSLIRRSAPQMIAYDLIGVQPMTGPTGMIFAIHARALDATGALGNELYGDAQAAYLNKGLQFASGNQPATVDGLGAAKVDTQTGEQLTAASSGALAWQRSTMTISRVTVTASTKALMAEFTDEIVQDMKNLHGIDAEAELANILSTEIAFEQNRELIERIRYVAKVYTGTAAGVVDLTVSAGGHFGAFGSAERFKALLLHIERASNEIARSTRRGKANWVLVSSDVAALLHLAGVMTINPNLGNNVDLADDTGALEVGSLIGGQKVVVDPYATQGQCIVGYKGKTPHDSGMFFCPYTPLSLLKTRDSNTMQPKIAFKCRYAYAANPFSAGYLTGSNTIANDQGLTADSNNYFRKFTVSY